MNKLFYPVAALSAILFFSSCENSQKDVERAKQAATIAHLRQYTEALSHDSCQGRKPFSPGAEKSYNYIAQQMKELGLVPGGDAVKGKKASELISAGNYQAADYMQKVNLILATATPSPIKVETKSPKGATIKRELKKGEDFVSFNLGRIDENINIKDAELVFAGYGIIAPEYGKDDYREIENPQNKIAVVMVNDPGLGSTDTKYFNGDAQTYYGRWPYKYDTGALKGFAGVLIIHEDRGAGYGWGVVVAGAGAKLFVDKGPDSSLYPPTCPLTGWINYNTANQLFADNGLNMAQLIEEAKKPDFKAVPLKSKLNMTIANKYERKSCYNLVGYVPGNQPDTDESVVYLAHWDHLGYGLPINGDSIINGTSDNATAVAWLLEMGRSFNALKNKPSKNIVFLSPTCEETGFLGVKYYIDNPIFPVEKTTAAINLDVIPLWGENNDVTITGYGEFPQMDSLIAVYAKNYNRYTMPDPEAYNGMYFRSDHFPFVLKGVPAIFAKGWSDSRKNGKEWSTNKIIDYWKNVYHKPTDQTYPDDDYSGLMQEVHLFFDLGYELAGGKLK